MELPEEVRKRLNELITSTAFRSHVCEATVIAHVGAYVEREILEVYISHLKNDDIPPSQKARNVGDLIHRILENEGDMLVHLLRRAFDECIEKTQGSSTLIVASSANQMDQRNNESHILKSTRAIAKVILMHPLAFISMASTAIVFALWLLEVITWEQLQTLLQYARQ